MPRTSRVARHTKMAKRVAAKRADGSYADKKFATKPKDKYKTRKNNMCAVTGRTRAFMRDFGVSRHVFRELADSGKIPGVRKSSW